MKNIFHISLPCKNIEETIKYYTEDLGLTVGRKAKRWFDITYMEINLLLFKQKIMR